MSSKPPVVAPVSADSKRVLGEAADLLRSLGHDVREAEPDYGEITAELVPRYTHGTWLDAQSLEHPERLERRVRQFVGIGRMLGPFVGRARAKEAARAARVNRIFDDHDVVMMPVAAQPPPRIGYFEGHSGLLNFLQMAQVYPYTPIWNLIGQPAASVPAGFSADGLPMGVQLGGRPNDEGTLISLAAQMEAERPWSERPPVS